MTANRGKNPESALADEVYTVLVDVAGAVDSPVDREQFRRFWWEADSYREYRFIGRLGFGGKLWIQPERMYVSCYREDETPERLEIVKRTNNALDSLARGWVA